MKIFKYLIGIWTAIAVYTLFSLIGGHSGLPAYNYLLAERDRQLENIKDLGNINEDLERTRFNLQYDQDTLMVHARLMGYGQADERFVRIVGLGNMKNDPVTAGNVYIASNPDFISDKSIKIAALFAGLLVFAFLFMLEIIESKSR
ncbi:septum formation initiator family protein [Treponema sp. R8-4-B8]